MSFSTRPTGCASGRRFWTPPTGTAGLEFPDDIHLLPITLELSDEDERLLHSGAGPLDEPSDEQQFTSFCPLCGSEMAEVDSESVPSMLGYGSDDSVKLACGHSNT